MGGRCKKDDVPPGFRFCPTDEELVVHFLYRKASQLPCNPDVIPDLDINLLNPWDLQGKALAGNNQWYFFSLKGKNHCSPNGHWMPEAGLEEVVSCGNRPVGKKKCYVFYLGEAPTGTKTNWLMDEYHLVLDRATSSSSSSSTSSPGSSRRRLATRKKTIRKEWVVCRVYEGSSGRAGSFRKDGTELSCLDEVFLSLDDLDDISLPNQKFSD